MSASEKRVSSTHPTLIIYLCSVETPEINEALKKSSRSKKFRDLLGETMGTSKFRLELYGLGLHAGIGSISKRVYDFWADNELVYEATEPFTEFDYKSIGVTSDSLKLRSFWGYCDVVKFDGVLLSNFSVVIRDGSGQHISSLDSEEFSEIAKDDPEYYVTELDEFYSDSLGKGYYFYWMRLGRSLWNTTAIDLGVDGFDPRKLRFETVDFEGESYIVGLIYGEEKLINFDSNISWEDPSIKLSCVKTSGDKVRGWGYELY